MPICVIDANIITPTNPRRLLTGFACLTGETIGLTPEVARSAAGSIARDSARREAQRRRRAGAWMSGEQFARIRNEVPGWFQAYATRPEGPFEVLCGGPTPSAETMARIDEMDSRIPDVCFRDSNRKSLDSDRQIVAEALVADVDMVLTNNLDSIDHVRLNRWCSEQLGRNAAFVVPADIGTQRLVDGFDLSDEDIALAALAMCVADRERPVADEIESAGVMLRSARGQLSFLANAALSFRARRGDADQPLVAKAREVRRSPPWSVSRAAEARRAELVRGP